MHINTTHNPDTRTNSNITIADTGGEDRDYTCPHYDRTSTSHIGLVGQLRIHRTETGEPGPGAPTYTRRTRHHCPYCPRTFMHRMGLFGHTRIHESGIDRSPDTPSTSSTPTMLSPTLTRLLCPPTTTTTTTISAAHIDTTDFSCPHRPRTLTSRISLVGHLRIHRTETGEPVPEVLAYTRRIRLHCPHCPRTFMQRMRHSFGHMRIHENPP
ncbi:hypothetical protein SprV_0200906200 [Sparganum proliferum]